MQDNNPPFITQEFYRVSRLQGSILHALRLLHAYLGVRGSPGGALHADFLNPEVQDGTYTWRAKVWFYAK